MMLSAFQTALRLVYPPRCLLCNTLVESDFGLCGPCWRDTPFITGLTCDLCGIPLPGEADGTAVHCDDCLKTERPWSKGRAVMLYRDNGRALVHALKYRDRQDMVRPAALWLGRAAAPLMTEDVLVAPVPLHWRRMVHRRFNQAALLGAAFAKHVGADYCPDLLRRHRKTAPLEGLGFAERFERLNGAITPNPAQAGQAGGRTVLLIDDVMTSGATLSASAEAVLAAGARDVRILTLARVPKDA